MIRYVLVLVGLLALNVGKAQERADSIQLGGVEAEILYLELPNVSEQSGLGPLLPDLFEIKPQLGWKNPLLFQPASDDDNTGIQGASSNQIIVHPLLSNFWVNSAATYRLGRQLSLTGSSISGNSIFNPVQPLDPSKMNFQGINLHFEYKVSDKFRIGGGVSVNRNSTVY